MHAREALCVTIGPNELRDEAERDARKAWLGQKNVGSRVENGLLCGRSRAPDRDATGSLACDLHSPRWELPMAGARSRGVSWRIEIGGWRDLAPNERARVVRMLDDLGLACESAGQVRIFDRALADRCVERLRLLRLPCRMTLLIHGFGELRQSDDPVTAA